MNVLLCLRVASDRDDVRRANEQLSVDCGQAQEELKRLRQAVEQMAREYEDSKELDFIRRYGVLKRMIKRTIMHLKLSNEDNIQSAAAASVPRGKRTDANTSGQINLSFYYHSSYHNHNHNHNRTHNRNIIAVITVIIIITVIVAVIRTEIIIGIIIITVIIMVTIIIIVIVTVIIIITVIILVIRILVITLIITIVIILIVIVFIIGVFRFLIPKLEAGIRRLQLHRIKEDVKPNSVARRREEMDADEDDIRIELPMMNMCHDEGDTGVMMIFMTFGPRTVYDLTYG